MKIIYDNDGKPLGHPARTEPFGGIMVDEKDVPERIRRAHRAILNPSTDRNLFLTRNEEDFPEREVEFTKNSVLLHVSGADIDDLSLCDLPGMKRYKVSSVYKLCSTTFNRPSCGPPG